MNVVNIVRAYINNPRLIPLKLMKMTARLWPDESYVKVLYFLKTGEKLDLKNPKTFNEKLNWIKLYDRNPLYSKLADKYEVKKFVADIIGEEYVVPNYGVWDNIDQIDFDSLPDKFVIKGTHDSSGAILCRDKSKFDIDGVRAKYRKIMKRNWFYAGREWPYKNIKPRIIVDQFLDDNTAGDRKIALRDYKFFCFNGKPKYMYLTVKDKDIYENFYDINFNVVDIDHGFPRHQPEFEKPKNYAKMWELAEKLAKASGTKWVRVDFFNVDGKIYFGEFTFYDWAGLRPFGSKDIDEKLGLMIEL